MATTAVPARRRYVPLSLEELSGALQQLPCWHCDGVHLERPVHPADLWQLLEKVAAVEEELDHHSEVHLENGTVTFSLCTHVRHAVTQADVELARRIEAVVAEVPQTP